MDTHKTHHPTTPDFDQWINYGIQQGWATPPICSTHDGIPMTNQEEQAWDQGEDPCIHIIRLIADNEQPNIPPWRN